MSFLDQISGFDKKNGLKPTETSVRTEDGKETIETHADNGQIVSQPKPSTDDFELDSDAVLKVKLESLSKLLQDAKYIVVFTGAGISTEAGVHSFRGKTALKGIGQLNEAALDFVMPTFAHLAITRLLQAGHIQFVVTSNHDNLHVKAGVGWEHVAELFGNVYVEQCLKCKTRYPRSVVVPGLGRKCDDSRCAGRLVKTGVRYGEATPEDPLRRATQHATQADLALVFGSSMTTSPFCELPGRAKRMVLVNAEPTPYDSHKRASFIRARCDTVLEAVLRHFSARTPSATAPLAAGTYTYEQKFVIEVAFTESGSRGKWRFTVTGAAVNEPCTCTDTITLYKPAASASPSASPSASSSASVSATAASAPSSASSSSPAIPAVNLLAEAEASVQGGGKDDVKSSSPPDGWIEVGAFDCNMQRVFSREYAALPGERVLLRLHFDERFQTANMRSCAFPDHEDFDLALSKVALVRIPGRFSVNVDY